MMADSCCGGTADSACCENVTESNSTCCDSQVSASVQLDDLEDVVGANSSHASVMGGFDIFSQSVQQSSISIKQHLHDNDMLVVSESTVDSGQESSDVDESEAINTNNFMAENFHVHVKTWGCAHNTSDSEYMAGLLKKYGFNVTLHGSEGGEKDDSNLISTADCLLLNSCTVKTPAQDHLRNVLQGSQPGKQRVVVAGCVPQADQKNTMWDPTKDGVISLIGVKQIHNICHVVEETIKGNQVRLFGGGNINGGRTQLESLNLPKMRRNPLIEIISINSGCLNSCTYCKTKQARGHLASYPIAEIVAQCHQAWADGCKEIWLTSEDTGAYGIDLPATPDGHPQLLPNLLEAILSAAPDRTMVRLGMTNPPYVMNHLAALARCLRHPRMYAFLHIPVQSASDEVLNAMKREYNVADFVSLIEYMRREVSSHMTMATDFILGFPTETDDDAAETVALIDNFRFPAVFINQFFPRPGTVAARWPQIDRRIIKRRTKACDEAFKRYTTYDEKDFLGTVHDVLVCEKASDGKHLVGHNKFYHQFLLTDDSSTTLMGKWCRVMIKECNKWNVVADVIEVEPDVLRLEMSDGLECVASSKQDVASTSTSRDYNISALVLVCGASIVALTFGFTLRMWSKRV